MTCCRGDGQSGVKRAKALTPDLLSAVDPLDRA